MLFGSSALEVAIGLFLIYFLGSVLVSHGTELFSALLNMRAKHLVAGIRELLGERDNNTKDPLSDLILENPIIVALRPRKEGRYPSYIPSGFFTSAFFRETFKYLGGVPQDVARFRQGIKSSPVLTDDVKDSLMTLLDHGVDNVKVGYDRVQSWFDQKMDRVSGEYKRWAQYMGLGLGIILSFVLNLDTLNMINAMSTDDPLRQAIVNQSEKVAGTGVQLTTNAASLDQLKSVFSSIHLPIGWAPFIKDNATLGDWISKLLGLLITGVALSFGAPFWYGLLNKAVSLKSSGKVGTDVNLTTTKVETPSSSSRALPPGTIS